MLDMELLVEGGVKEIQANVETEERFRIKEKFSIEY